VFPSGVRNRPFALLWTAFAASTAGSTLALDAFPLVALVVLDASALQVALLAAAGRAAGAVLAVPLGPWVDARPKRPVMIGADLLRLGALTTLPLTYVSGHLTFAHLVAVSVIVAAATIASTAASGAYLKTIVPADGLLRANARFEATTWTATALGPPLGGWAIGVLGPLTTIVLDALSYLASALSLVAIRVQEARPLVRRTRVANLADGWRHLLGHPLLRPVFLNTVLVNALIMAGGPVLAVLMLRDLAVPPWKYGLVFGVSCLGGLLGSRIARPLVARFGALTVLRAAGTLRACWPVGLAFVRPGTAGLVTVTAIELALITCIGVYNPVMATYRLKHTPTDQVARMLTAWSITGGAAIAVTTALCGVLAGLTGARTALAVAGVLLLATPLLLRRISDHEVSLASRP
jgi:MFS family permease